MVVVVLTHIDKEEHVKFAVVLGHYVNINRWSCCATSISFHISFILAHDQRNY